MAPPHASRRRPLLVAAIVAVAGCATVGVAAATEHRSRAFAPPPGPPVDRVLHGSPGHPALSTQGVAVAVTTGRTSLLVDATGPQVPVHGALVALSAVTCTFTVTLSGATADEPLDLGQWSAFDHLGRTYRLDLVAGTVPLPPVLHPGQRVTAFLRATLPPGEGIVRFAPDGHAVAADWDFSVETD